MDVRAAGIAELEQAKALKLGRSRNGTSGKRTTLASGVSSPRGVGRMASSWPFIQDRHDHGSC